MSSNPWKVGKSAPRKRYLQKFLQILQSFLSVTFLLAKFSHFSQQFRNHRKILRCFDTHSNFVKKIRLYQHFFETLKPNSHETAQNLFFKSVNHNRCTLLCSARKIHCTGVIRSVVIDEYPNILIIFLFIRLLLFQPCPCSSATVCRVLHRLRAQVTKPNTIQTKPLPNQTVTKRNIDNRSQAKYRLVIPNTCQTRLQYFSHTKLIMVVLHRVYLIFCSLCCSHLLVS